jgi:hypothetical protein
MNAQVLKKYKMNDAKVAKLLIQITKMQNIVIFVL